MAEGVTHPLINWVKFENKMMEISTTDIHVMRCIGVVDLTLNRPADTDVTKITIMVIYRHTDIPNIAPKWLFMTFKLSLGQFNCNVDLPI